MTQFSVSCCQHWLQRNRRGHQHQQPEAVEQDRRRVDVDRANLHLVYAPNLTAWGSSPNFDVVMDQGAHRAPEA